MGWGAGTQRFREPDKEPQVMENRKLWRARPVPGTNGEQDPRRAGLAVQEPTRRAHRLAVQVQEQTREDHWLVALVQMRGAHRLAVVVQMRAARHLVVMEQSAKALDLQ